MAYGYANGIERAMRRHKISPPKAAAQVETTWESPQAIARLQRFADDVTKGRASFATREFIDEMNRRGRQEREKAKASF